VPDILLATDADWIRDDVDAALTDPDTTVSRVRKGAEVVAAMQAIGPDLVILDLQIGNMGGIATTHAICNEVSAGRLDDAAIMLLLDRPDDRWLAGTSGADGWLVKPLDGRRLRKATRALLAGERYDEAPPTAGVTSPTATPVG
jgi:DNA-binding response OmpR family regulator